MTSYEGINNEISGNAVDVTAPGDVAAAGVSSPYTAGNGSVSFFTLDGNIVVSYMSEPVVVHKTMGSGHVVLIGHDYYESSTEQNKIVGNAVLRLAGGGQSPGPVIFSDDMESGQGGWTHTVVGGSEFGLSWVDTRNIDNKVYFVRITAAGAKLGSDSLISYDSGGFTPSVGWADGDLVWTGSEFGLSWDDNRDGNREIYFSRVSFDGATIGPNQRVTFDPFESHNPSLIWPLSNCCSINATKP